METEVKVDYTAIKKESYKPRYEYYNKREREYQEGERGYGWNIRLAVFGWVYYAYKRTYKPAVTTLIMTLIMGVFGGKYGVLLTHLVLGITGEAVYISALNKKIYEMQVDGFTVEEIQSGTRPNKIMGVMAFLSVASIIFLGVFTIFMLGTA